MTRREFLARSAAQAALMGVAAATGCATAKGRPAQRAVGADVRNGIDVLVRDHFEPLRDLRVGLITNHTGEDRDRRATIDLLKEAQGVKLVALFGPEHGIRGEFDEKVGDTTDQKTGLPVYSLYGERRAPTPEQLRGLDALVFDVQDIGCRFYTYPSTMGLCMEAAAAAKLKFYVLDRVNPINGNFLEGPVHRGERKFIAFYPVPLRHGMTVGELAQMFKTQQKLDLDLTVIPVDGWARGDWFDETGLPWTNPSPNMRSVPAAILYPGLGLHETALSVGRGTDKPFEMIGAPYIDDVRLARELREAGLPGVNFVPVRFKPTYSTFKDKECSGIAFVITDRETLNAVDVGIELALALQRLWPGDFALNKVNTLLLDDSTIAAIREGKALTEIKAAWAAELRQFAHDRKPHLIY